jgi:hypothetical protein
VDRENSKNEEEEDGHPRTQLGSFHYYKKSPESQEYQEREDQSLRRERKVKMA